MLLCCQRLGGVRMEWTEKRIENYLVRRIKSLGGKAYKFISPGNTGVPDRLIIVPVKAGEQSAIICFVELKRPGKQPRPQQVAKMNELGRLGCRCYVADSTEAVDKAIGVIESERETWQKNFTPIITKNSQ